MSIKRTGWTSTDELERASRDALERTDPLIAQCAIQAQDIGYALNRVPAPAFLTLHRGELGA